MKKLENWTIVDNVKQRFFAALVMHLFFFKDCLILNKLILLALKYLNLT